MKYINDEETRKKIILATSAMPFVFPTEEIDGHPYGDGGARIWHGDNVPVKPLYEIDQCNIILVVHLSRVARPIDREKFPGAALYELFPRKELGTLFNADGILDFTAEGAVKRMQQGYDENIELFRWIREDIDREKGMEEMIKEAIEREKRVQAFLRFQDESIERIRQEIKEIDDRRRRL